MSDLLNALVAREARRSDHESGAARDAARAVAECIHTSVFDGVEPDPAEVEELARAAWGEQWLDHVADLDSRARTALAVRNEGQQAEKLLPSLRVRVNDARDELRDVEDLLCRVLAPQARRRGADRAAQLATAKEQLGANPALASQLLTAQAEARDAEGKLRLAENAVARGQQVEAMGLRSWWVAD